MMLQLHHTQIILTEEVAVVLAMAALKEQAELEMLEVILHQKEIMVAVPEHQIFTVVEAEDLLAPEAPAADPEDQADHQLLLQLLEHLLRKLEVAEEQVFLVQEAAAAEAEEPQMVLLTLVILDRQLQIQVLDQEEREEQVPQSQKEIQVMVDQDLL